MGIARSHRPGHIGTTPQNTDELLAASRVAGMLHDFVEHPQGRQVARIDADMHRPAVAAAPGYFRDDWTAAQITGSAAMAQLNGHRQFQEPKTLGGYDPTPGAQQQ